MAVDKAFILAAGKGTRLRPYTDNIPKPMIEVGGRPMIDLALDKLAEIGVQHCSINTHYKAEVLEAHMEGRETPYVKIWYEEVLLDTGGGIRNALDDFDEEFFVLSGDSVWEEEASGENLLRDLVAAWVPEKMDILIVLQPAESMVLTQGVGDYDLDDQGRAVRSLDKSGAYMFTSIRINAKCIFDVAPDTGVAFSYLELLDAAQAAGRLYGIVNKGMWHHISTPQDLENVNAAMRESK